MGEHKRIVIEDYPVENLPEELRGGIEPGHRVTVTVEEASDRWSDLFRRIDAYQSANARPVTTEEAVARVRALRDEWD
ncbi:MULTISPECIES: hypothetical protein [unclassified Aureimonas]|uniref:hypothetical protein n=1 Tax=unclassified Aureimonas TaxID=2615206 RepID=UPI000720A304|nr:MULTISPECIES: hypothetical protein [unclassified Aureimonas]ALN71971.1 hypothetical protein M673_04540 [Aureimonas sp. AU20]